MAIEALNLADARAAIVLSPRRSMTPQNNPALLSGYSSGYGGFAAAPMSRTNQDWIAHDRTADQNLVMDLRRLRNKARERAINSPTAAKYLSIMRTQVVGAHGIRVEYTVPKLRARTDDELIDDAICEELLSKWEAWCHRGVCTVDGKRSLRDALLLAMDCLARDGECFIRRRYVAKTTANPFGFALQMIDATQVDEKYNTQPDRDGNQVRMGVEVDADMRPLAYHVIVGFPSEAGERQRVRIAAEEVYHFFTPRFIAQTRGYPMMAPALYDMHQLDDYFKAELTAARWGAKMVGAIETTGNVEFTGEDSPASSDPVRATTVGDATLFDLGTNRKLASITPQHPVAAFSPFTETALRQTASALNVPYHALANNYGSINFSAGRLAENEARDFYEELQSMMIDALVQPIHDDWIRASLLNGALDVPFDLQRYTSRNARAFIPRAWHGIQPFEEAKTDILEISNGLSTKAKVMHRKGLDWRQTLKQLAIESGVAEALKLKLGTDTTGKATSEIDGDELPEAPPAEGK